jgi:nucleoside-diphosphate-sugar epimerase
MGMTQARVLIAGTGLIGSAVARVFTRIGAAVSCADLDGDRAAACGAAAAAVDLADADAVAALLAEVRPALVIHAAGHRAAAPGQLPATLIADAAATTWTLAEQAARAKVSRVVLVSSLGVYGGSVAPVTESTLPVAVTPYGAAKLAAEAALTGAIAGTPTQWFIARLAGVYGGPVTGGGGRLNETLAGLLRRYLSGVEVVVPAGLGGRELLHASDAGEALARVAAHGREGVYNIGTGSPVRTQDIAAAFAALGANARAESDHRAVSWLDVSKARHELGFTARIALAEGLSAWATVMADDLAKEGELDHA